MPSASLSLGPGASQSWDFKYPGLSNSGAQESWVGCNGHVLHLRSPRKLRRERHASPIRLELPVSSIRLESHVLPHNGPSLPPPTDWKSRLQACSPPLELGLLVFSVWSGKSCLSHQTW